MDNTISIQNGNFSKVCQNHNLRKGEFAHKEHIDPNGTYEIWQHQSLEEFYKNTFNQYLDEYNQKQIKNHHPERQINDYLDYIKTSNAKAKPQPCYEMIAQVGSVKQPVDERTAHNILKEFYLEFEKKNPNLKIVGCYYHADEATPHIHLDYVPVAGLTQPYKSGLKVQNSLTKACHEMGIEHKAHTTEQILLQERMRDDLKSICSEYGINVVSPTKFGRGNRSIHFTPEQWRAIQDFSDTYQSQVEASIRHVAKLYDIHNKCLDLEQTVSDLQYINKQKKEDMLHRITELKEASEQIQTVEAPNFEQGLIDYLEQDDDLAL